MTENGDLSELENTEELKLDENQVEPFVRKTLEELGGDEVIHLRKLPEEMYNSLLKVFGDEDYYLEGNPTDNGYELYIWGKPNVYH